MNRDHLKSAADKAAGAVKEGVGKATGNQKLETEGRLDEARGEAREVVGDAKDAVRRATKS